MNVHFKMETVTIFAPTLLDPMNVAAMMGMNCKMMNVHVQVNIDSNTCSCIHFKADSL